MSNVIKGMIIGMICGAIVMIALSFFGHIEWGGLAVGICVLLGVLIGNNIR